MRGWKDLELVETIYEEEDDHEDEQEEEEGYSSNSPSMSQTPSPSPPTPLQSIAKTWSLATGKETDVVIHVQDQSFHLHKNSLISKSAYLKRALADTNDLTLPLNITAETFSSIVDYCYTYRVLITPFNVAALKVATELLEMENDNHNGNGTNNLRQKTEAYFEKAVSVNQEFACVVLRSSLALLPDAEAGSMAGRCIEALTLSEDGGGDVNGWVDEIVLLGVEKFQIIVDSLHERFGQNHDLLYRLVDLYLQEHSGEISEQQKIDICSSVDCNRLSPHLIVHAVQNPRMPLRFIVRAMLFEQLQTRRCIISTTTSAANSNRELQPMRSNNHQAMTLGALLQRDAAFRQVAHLKQSMEATSCKIESLEKDLVNMKKVLEASKKNRESLESGRSVSFRLSSERKIDRVEGKPHSTSLRFTNTRDIGGLSSSSSSSELFINENMPTKKEKSFGRKFMNGIKNVLKISSATSKQDSESRVSGVVDGNGVRDAEVDAAIVALKRKARQSHFHSRSLEHLE